MAKILILANNDVGLYRFRRELIEQLVKDYEVYISLPYGDLVPNLEDLGCKFINTDISRRGTNPLTDLKLFMTYKNIIKNIRPDVVLTYTIKPNVYGGLASRISSVPYITNITGLGTAVENESILQKVTLFLYKNALRKAKCVFFQNEDNLKFFIERNVIGSKYRLIPGSGVNLQQYKMLDYPGGNNINFLFVARVMKEKGIDQFLEAAEYIRKKHSNTRFHVLGFCEENYEKKLEELQKKNIIKYHGMQSDVKKFHAFSHCTIHPTYYPEGMSNVLLESASCGRPIITTNRSGCREIVEEGVNGYVVNQKDTKDLIIAIEKFLSLDYNLKRNMGIQGRKKIEKEFNRNIVINAYLEEVKESV
ncbi:glycosyltransferase family 4 protein [Priestia megaterium]|uniref:glycosyltransferase family 4 protein n=1 Tax=Priestia megaterium TaxID=1404 RepID=UPI001F371968|nr:glycosyltransferase family 4 protein [Priestia megaterium]MCF8888176.1 glycosyltransferase family 4 protein [Priestia megaterium]